ncbi:PPC domain-containing DNA-binding protein [Haladaptatus caseinilyticus]|uniref:PPC domain-containing DNA-binding protein n=1 Tax=Haladaptatus caseinilyticus TaxID=2993314 RepID=UPI00224B47BB|nr:PPC domain-containing DNA-binding protein [Haladaptatus caseinilyticus]
MEYVDEANQFIVRLDPGDQVLDSLSQLRETESIESAFFTGIGAVDEVTLGHYDVERQQYHEETFKGEFEVTNFTGNIGPDKIHSHIQLGKRNFESIGGHCSGARVSGTFELIVQKGETPLRHQLDERTGLNVFEL